PRPRGWPAPDRARGRSARRGARALAHHADRREAAAGRAQVRDLPLVGTRAEQQHLAAVRVGAHLELHAPRPALGRDLELPGVDAALRDEAPEPGDLLELAARDLVAAIDG